MREWGKLIVIEVDLKHIRADEEPFFGVDCTIARSEEFGHAPDDERVDIVIHGHHGIPGKYRFIGVPLDRPEGGYCGPDLARFLKEAFDNHKG